MSDYDDYLESPEWQRLRSLVIARDGGQCVLCGCRDFLQVHHMTYARLFNEDPADLATLCSVCHAAWHDKGEEREAGYVPPPSLPGPLPPGQFKFCPECSCDVNAKHTCSRGYRCNGCRRARKIIRRSRERAAAGLDD